MSKPFLSIRWRGRKAYGNIQKDKLLGKAFDSGLRGMVFHWKHNFMPMHFRNVSRSRYRYAPRSGERGYPVPPRYPPNKGKSSGRIRKFKHTYTGKKLARFNHTRPLVHKNNSIFGAAKNANRVTTDVNQPGELTAKLQVMSRLLNLRGSLGYVKHHVGGPHSSYLDELSAIHPSETGPLATAFKKSFRTKWRRTAKSTLSYQEIK